MQKQSSKQVVGAEGSPPLVREEQNMNQDKLIEAGITPASAERTAFRLLK